MKHLFGFFVAFALALTGVGFTGCSDDKTDEPVPPPVVDPSFEVKLGTVGINDAEITLTTAAVPEYAYIVAEADAQAPSATTIYATGKVESLTDGENKLNITGLEAATQYTVYFAYKVEDQFADVVDLDFTTTNYTELFTITDRGPDYISFHIEVDADTYYKISMNDWMTAKSMSEQFGTSDFDFIRSGVLFKGPQTITFKNGEPIYPDDPDAEGYNWNVMAGQCFRLIIAECDETGTDYGSVEFDELGDPIINWYGFQQTEKVNAGDAIPSQYKVAVEIERLTTRSVEIFVNPDEEIAGYGCLFGTKPEIDSYIEEVGLAGVYAMALGENSTLAGVEPAKYSWDKILLEGIEYSFITVGIEEDITRQTVDRMDFTPKSATMPAPQVVVTHIDNPEGENSAFQTWFNVKATNADAASAVYAFNTAAEWKGLFKEGATYLDVLDQYGNDMGEAAVTMINSAEGLNIAFDTEEETAFVLAVGLYNSEETMGEGHCEVTTPSDTPDAPVSSSLFTELLGDWTGTVSDNNGKVYTFKVTIANEVEAGPTTLPENVYDLYPNFTREEVDTFFAEYKEGVTETNAKYKGKNRLVCRGLQVDPYASYYERMDYLSPWDLFIHPNYDNSSTKEVFRDYGPKWFLQIAEGDVVTVPTDRIRIPILCNWADPMYLMAYESSGSYNVKIFTPDFPVTVSADKQTLTVGPFVDGEKTYYPSVSFNQRGYETVLFRGGSPIVLTKGYDEPAVTANMKARRNYRTEELQTNVKLPVMGKMTRLDGNRRKLMAKRVDMSAAPLSGERLSLSAEAGAAKLARTNR